MKISISPEAKDVMRKLITTDPDAESKHLRLTVQENSFQYAFAYDKEKENDHKYKLTEDKFLVIDDLLLTQFLAGAKIDWKSGIYGEGFSISKKE